MSRSQWAYLGTLIYDQSAGGFVAQRVDGAWVRPSYLVTPSVVLNGTAGVLASVDLRTAGGSPEITLPTTASGLYMVDVGFEPSSPGDYSTIYVQDDPASSPVLQTYSIGQTGAGIPPSGTYDRHAIRIMLHTNGGVTRLGKRGEDATAKVVAYQDSILAMR